MKSKMTLDKIADRYLSHNSRHTQVPVPTAIPHGYQNHLVISFRVILTVE